MTMPILPLTQYKLNIETKLETIVSYNLYQPVKTGIKMCVTGDCNVNEEIQTKPYNHIVAYFQLH